jgi:predicted TIM-barrel fold metal-dependent hydrolase
MTPVDSISRRALLGALSALAGAGLTHAFPGAAWAASCPNSCRSMISAKDQWIRGLPVIDAHCHIFNARDIPAIHFITKVILPHYAPELSATNRRRLEAEIGEYAAGVLGRTPGFHQERAVLEARLAGESEEVALAGADALPKFARGSARACYGSDVAHNIGAVRNLITILTRFRHQNFESLLATNAMNVPDVGVALFTPAMVDMDYWLGFGGEGESTIGDVGTDAFSLRQSAPDEQVKLTEMIQRLHPGRCHGFVSFCPWRQADDTHHNAFVGEGSARRRQTALETVKDAILNRGLIGVKLYPPMGFQPLGNAAIPIDGFPAAAAATSFAQEFGLRIDAALLSLYNFCAEHDVPVMAHTAPSNGAGVFRLTKDKEIPYEERAHPRGWARVLAQPGLGGLKVNLAHFGSGPKPKVKQEWRAEIGKLMDAYPNVYTDLAHYPELLMDNYTGSGQHCFEASQILTPIRTGFLAGEPGVTRARRMLYGSDWSMLSKEYYYADYLPVLAHMYRRKIYSVGAGAEKNAQGFLSGNAARFMGLRQGDKARARLEAWYSKHNLDPGLLRRFDGVEG